jgi:uncharacterized protein with beta-barrel porin domain
MGATTGVWASLCGQFGVLNATGNTASMGTGSGGLALGLDGLLGDTRLVAILYAGRSSLSSQALNTTINSTDFGLGIYGATDLVGFDLNSAPTISVMRSTRAERLQSVG